jgi:hypothetical protein
MYEKKRKKNLRSARESEEKLEILKKMSGSIFMSRRKRKPLGID